MLCYITRRLEENREGFDVAEQFFKEKFQISQMEIRGNLGEWKEK